MFNHIEYFNTWVNGITATLAPCHKSSQYAHVKWYKIAIFFWNNRWNFTPRRLIELLCYLVKSVKQLNSSLYSVWDRAVAVLFEKHNPLLEDFVEEFHKGRLYLN